VILPISLEFDENPFVLVVFDRKTHEMVLDYNIGEEEAELLVRQAAMAFVKEQNGSGD
jgi:hypothetical protein